MMKTKIYELVGMDACRMQTTYCGIKVNMEFKNGNHLNGKKAVLITSNPFVQDAIENDPRFGETFRLSKVYDNGSGSSEGQKEKEDEKRPATLSGKGRKKKTQAELDKEKASLGSKEDKYTEVAEVGTVNDAIDYFTSLGEVVEDESQIRELMDKHLVRFPNMQ